MLKTSEPNPDDKLVEAGTLVKASIDQTLRDMLGEDGAKATFFHVGLTNYDKESHQFHIRLFSIFSNGTSTIERLIIKDLFKRLDIPFFQDAEINYEKSIQLELKVTHERLSGHGRPRR